MNGKKRLAIVYDWFDKWGGVERVLLHLNKIFPMADFFTSYFNQSKASWAKKINVKTSFIDSFPTFIKNSRLFSVPFYPFAFEAMDFSDYEMVISVTSSYAKSIITKPVTRHICYLLTPTRFLWVSPEIYQSNKLANFFTRGFVDYQKKWDLVVAQRPDEVYSISENIADRCLRLYGRKSEVIYPPFDNEYWQEVATTIERPFKIGKNNIKEKFFLVVSRLEPYKKVDLVVETFNKISSKKLIIVGEGTEFSRLKKMAKNNISLFGKVTDKELGYLYKNAEALIMPQIEDFGYVALESLFFNCPVIAYKKGGVLETVFEKQTGILFNDQTSDSIINAVETYHTLSYNIKDKIPKIKDKILAKFDKKIFEKSFLEITKQTI